MFKFVFWFLLMIVATLVALIPEFAMYLTYHMIEPQSDLTKALLIVAFWLGGSSLCFAFGVLGFGIAATATKAVLE